MLVSYQVLGLKQDTASISLFEFDEETSSVIPNNFIIVTQQIDLHSNKVAPILLSPRGEDDSPES